MARRVIIPITDYNDTGVCNAYFSVRYRLTSGGGWTQLPNQFGEADGSPAVESIIVENLDDDVEYEIGYIRHCCDGTASTEELVTVTTTP